MFIYTLCITILVFLAVSEGSTFLSCTRPYPVLQEGMCYKACKPGYEGKSTSCEKNKGCQITRMDSRSSPTQALCYSRGAGISPQSCSSISFRKEATNFVPKNTSFTMIISNDPQLIWWQDPPNAKKCDQEPSCKKRFAAREAQQQVQAMNSILDLQKWPGNGKRVRKPRGVIINGDLTQYFHPRELDLFEMYYNRYSNSPSEHVLRFDVFLGLGNHDYANNLDDCFWYGVSNLEYIKYMRNGCAQRAVDYIKSMISCGSFPSFPSKMLESFDAGSLAYSWNMGLYHFIQLHNYPAFEAEQVNISDSFKWLENDLWLAKSSGKRIIVNLHDLGDKFRTRERQQFIRLIEETNVVAIFCGHVIGSNNLGFQGNLGSVPVFRGGHAGELNRNRFLLVDFAPTYLRVLVVSSFEGRPKSEHKRGTKFDKTVHF